MKKARMNISHYRFILFNLKIFGEIVTTKKFDDLFIVEIAIQIFLTTFFSENPCACALCP